MSWNPHIKDIKRKLNYATATLNRIQNFVPEHMHKDLYYTLFESHLSYCISVWGGISQNKLSSLFSTQKQCLRILFGDRNAFLDKFRTCARVRPFGFQILGESFYCQEHTKPLFSHLGLLTIQNLYSYHCLMEIFKILKFRAPISLHSLYTISQRKTTTLITPHPTNSFIYKSANMWNTLQSKLKIMDYSINLSKIKIEIKKLLLTNQVRHDDTEWYCSNFDLKAIGKPSTNFQI